MTYKNKTTGEVITEERYRELKQASRMADIAYQSDRQFLDWFDDFEKMEE
jgi:hypothetical protein